MGTGFSKKKKQAKMLQQQLTQFQSQLQTTEVVGTAGNGLVTITLTGDNDMKTIKIKPDCVDPEDTDGLETLIKAAYNDAQSKLKAQSMPNMSGIAGMPGLDALGL